MIIRKATIDDLETLQNIFADSITYVCGNDYDTRQLEVWRSGIQNKERWHDLIRNQWVLAAVIDHKIVGFCSLENGNYIDLLFVHQNYLRQGIALKLYTQIEQESKQKGETRLTADVSKTARPFFERVGFKVLKEQTVNVKGIDFINYNMEKILI